MSLSLIGSAALSQSASDSEYSVVSGKWAAHCRAIKSLRSSTLKLYLKVRTDDALYRDMSDLMAQWDRADGLPETLKAMCDSWNDVMEEADEHQLDIKTLYVVAGVLVQVGLFTGGTDFTTAYELLYASVRSHVSCGSLDTRAEAVLARVFSGCTSEELTVTGLEASYLKANPIDVDEETADPWGEIPTMVSIPDPVEAVYLPGLVASLPTGFAGNKVLQTTVQRHILACRIAIEQAFEEAGLGYLAPTQVDSIFSGTTMQQYKSEKPFGQY
jgi:hypothetical protein